MSEHPNWQTPFRLAATLFGAGWCLAWYTAAWLAGAAWSRMRMGWDAATATPPPADEHPHLE